MVPISELIPAFLQDRGLDAPDGRPLYAYRCRDEEFQALSAELAAELPRRPRHGRWSLRLEQAFCLWLAEWWRRNHEGGAWSWDRPLLELGCGALRPQERGYGELCKAVESGIRHWKRDLLRSGHGRAFLVTLACEGGLPLKLVLREQAGLRRYFRALLEEFRASASLGKLPKQMAERVRGWLPRSLQQDVVYELSGELIRKIWELQAEVGETPTPVKALDQSHPRWRDEMPLHLDDEVARSLLNNLVAEASVLARRRGRRLRWRRTLLPSSGGWLLAGEFELPASLDVTEFGELFGLQTAEPPPRFELVRVAEGGVPELLALGNRRFDDAGGEYLALEPTSRTSRRKQGLAAVAGASLLARDGRSSWPTTDFAGSEPLSDDLPWIFEPHGEGQDEELRLVGEGSAKLRALEAVVAVPAGSSVQLAESEAEGELSDVGTLAEPGRTVYRLSGSAEIRDDEGGLCVVTTGVEGAGEPSQYRLQGPRAALGIGSSDAFLGLPQVIEDSASGITQPVRAEHLRWRPANTSGGWLPYSDACRGDVRLRHVVGGEVRFSANAKVLPENAEIAVRPAPQGTEVSEGTIELRGFRAQAVAAESDRRVECVVKATGVPGDHDVAMRCIGQPPRTARLTIAWSGDQRLRLDVPFPAQGASFHRPGGGRLEDGERVSVRNLSGVHGRSIVARGGCTFYVDGVYRGRGVQSGGHHLTLRVRVPEVGEGHFEYDLGHLQSRVELMLSMTDDVDGVIQVELQSNEARGLAKRTLRLGHYDLEFERGDGEVTLSSSSFAKVSPETMANLRVEAFQLNAPQEPPIQLQKVRNGVWAVPEEEMKPGAWLAVGWDGGWCRMRPCLLLPGFQAPKQIDKVDAEFGAPEEEETQPNIDDGTATHTARWASAFPTRDSRVAAFTKLMREMACDVAHADWEVLDGTVQWIRDLPATTFDLIDALIRVPEAAALAVVRASDDDFSILWDRIETLPFSWRSLPVGAWEQAIECQVQGLRNEFSALGEAAASLNPEARVREEFERVTNRVTQRLDCLNPLFAVCRSRLFGGELGPEEQMLLSGALAQMFLDELEKHRKDLLRDRADFDQWPGGGRLEAEVEVWKGWPIYDDLWLHAPAGVGFRQDVLDAPVLAAILAAEGRFPDRTLMQDLRRLAEFAPQWYADAHRSAFLVAYGRVAARAMENQDV